MARPSSRERILDALQEILVRAGLQAVTLDAVAEAAHVSKGGLLYHFPSKEALLDALVQRACDTAEAEFAEAEATDDIISYYFGASQPSGSEAALIWSLVSMLRNDDAITHDARKLTTSFFARWNEIIKRRIDDPVLAELVLLAGDGLYLRALTGLPMPDGETIDTIARHLAEQAASRSHQADT